MSTREQQLDAQFRGAVDPQWYLQGAWLSRAWEKFGGRWTQEARAAQAKFADLRDGETPEAFAYSWEQRNKSKDMGGRTLEEFIWSTPPRPSKSFYNEIGKALLRDEQPSWFEYSAKRYLAETQVFLGLTDGRLRAYGSRDHTASEPMWIPTRAWQDLQRDRAQRDRVFADGIMFYHVHVVWPLEILATAAPSKAEDKGAPATLNGKAKRGPKAHTLPRVVAAMKDELSAGVVTTEELSTTTEKELAARHSASRDTARKARSIVLAKTPTNSDK